MVTPPDKPLARCTDVDFDMRDEHYGESAADADLGDLLWNPKGAEGHVLVAEVRCGDEHNAREVDCSCGGWGRVPCHSTTLVCECGEDGAARDHHYVILSRAIATR